MIIYLVTKGEYSDCETVMVCADRAVAESALAKGYGDAIAEHTVTTALPETAYYLVQQWGRDVQVCDGPMPDYPSYWYMTPENMVEQWAGISERLRVCVQAYSLHEAKDKAATLFTRYEAAQQP